MKVPVEATKVILGSLLVCVRALLKIKNMPEPNRSELQTAEKAIANEIAGMTAAEEMVRDVTNLKVAAILSSLLKDGP